MGGSLHEVGDRIREKAGESAERLREGYEYAGDELARRYHQAEGVMAHNPTTSIVIGFGLGFGLGLFVTTMLAGRERESWAQRHTPDRLRRLPESLHGTLEQLADTVRHLPDAIREHIPSTMGWR
jgi:hypothetical protein